MAKSKAYHNGQHSVNPVVAEFDVLQEGITKREHFASLAPDNTPQWFQQVFSETAKPELTWHRESNDFQVGECGWTQEGERALYFAWRTYYADALLAELEK